MSLSEQKVIDIKYMINKKENNIYFDHISEIMPYFQRLIEKLEVIKEQVIKNSNLRDHDQDARLIELDAMQMDIQQVRMWMNAFFSLASKCSTPHNQFDQNEFLHLLGSNLALKQTENYMFKTLRLGFVTLQHFKLDSLFYSVLCELNVMKKSSIKSYSYKVKEILNNSIGMNEAKKDCLLAFAYIRNSLHTNGIHRNRSIDINIDNIQFSFEKGKKLECAGWKHVVILLEKNIDILEEILNADTIMNLKNVIKDDFAEQELFSRLD